MENQRNSGLNPLLSNTSRQFYSRRVLQRPHSNAQLDKILKMLNHQQEKKSFSRTKTEHNEDSPAPMQAELGNMLKFAKIKLENLMKKQMPEWRQLYDLFEKFKKSSSVQVLKTNEVNFLLKMQEIMKIGVKQQDRSSERLRGKGKWKQGKFSLQTIKLHKQNQILKQQLDSFEQKQRKIQGTRHMHHIKTSSDQPCELFNRIQKDEYAEMTRELQCLRQANIIYRDEKRALQEKINQLKTSNENLCEEVLKLRTSSNGYLYKLENWRNIMSMQNQQIISLKRDIADVKKQFFDLYKKYSNNIKRMTKSNSNNHQKLNQITNKTVELFTEQIESFQRIRCIFTIRGFYNISAGKQQRQLLSMPYKRYMSDKDSFNNPEGIKKMGKEYFRYFKPSFFVFLEKYFEYQGVDKENFEQINLSVGMHFLNTLRGILDSKHNEYIMAKNIGKSFSSLSSFTVSWLCNYKIDHKTRRQQQINTDLCFETIGSFYARLMSNQLNGNWQVITFREFLLDTLTIDQLIFYLKARFKLMRGDCLTGSAAFLEVRFVNYLNALLLIQQLVTDFDYRKKLQQYIKRSVQFQRKKQLIDAHFILRLLLQYYQNYKSKVFVSLSKTFINFTRDRNTNMPFESYLKIYDYNFFEINLISKVEIYQKAFSLGRGVVNLQNIFTVMNQDGYLCGEVEKMFGKNKVFQQAQDDTVCQRRPSEIQKFQVFYQNFCQKNLNIQISKLGLQNIKIKTNLLKTSKILSYEILFQRLQIIHNVSMLNLKKLFHSKKIKQAQLLSFLPNQIEFYNKLVKFTLQKSEIHLILQQFRKKTAARVIMKFYRKKKGLFVKNYFLSTQNIEKTNKIEQVRKQFSSIIVNIKNNYNSSNIQQTINQYDEID